MGYAGKLHRFLQLALQQPTADDQRAFNDCCVLVTRDTSDHIFQNISGLRFKACTPVDHSDAVFVSFPASGGCGSVSDRLAAYWHWNNIKRLFHFVIKEKALCGLFCGGVLLVFVCVCVKQRTLLE